MKIEGTNANFETGLQPKGRNDQRSTWERNCNQPPQAGGGTKKFLQKPGHFHKMATEVGGKSIHRREKRQCDQSKCQRS